MPSAPIDFGIKPVRYALQALHRCVINEPATCAAIRNATNQACPFRTA